MGRLSGKIAFVTGAGGGIGRAIAFAMAREGAKVALADINQELLAEAAAAANGLDVVPVVCDVSDRDDVKAKLDQFVRDAGGLDILVNNAVVFHYAQMVDFNPEIVDRMLNVGLKGTYWCLQAATPHLKARGGGAIINLSSIAVSMSIPNASIYTSIKGAIDALTRQQAAELGAYGIRVNAVAPGSVPTPGANSVIDESGWKNREQKSVLKRLPSAEDIGHAAVFLASDEAVAITGVTLKIDAGMTITGP
ncbi:SDR family NAD(P)-dependent oxidoreductase [Roseibium marinum]|uniref:3-oxoacyl-[acyl-carrier protein] reductase n=1 Tax=Roseibium marinum TaxID=281252 RepID=A0A2S3UNG4_9HYPH|nr:SDR family oxidoreductase [Roseibium marinum]POF29120.1 3-oxoacyl-[acyl-carrier protein] reductase [Roseibium marinum]